MKQFARILSLSAVLIASGMSLNTQALELEEVSFDANIELQIARLKAEALVSVTYELKEQLKLPRNLFLGNVAKPAATELKLAQHSDNVLDNMAKLAD